MKKYLMTGVAALAFAATFTSCSKSGDLYDESKVNEQKEKNITESYAAAFEKAFGKVGANVDWGFSSKAGTRTTQKEYHRWGKEGGIYADLAIPTPLTAEERADVTNYFATTEFTDAGIPLNWTEYYVEWVSNVASTSAERRSTGEKWQQNITFDKISVSSTNSSGYEEILDWNGNNYPTYYMYETVNTDKFRAHISYVDGTENDKWTTRFTIQEYKGNYYVGFDLDVTKQSDGVIDLGKETRGFYNDFIIRLVPGKGQPIPNTHLYRVIAEDLTASQSGDFDFNDVVFDVVSYDQSTDKTTLRLQACGGTLPLMIGSTKGANGVEVHSLYGDNTPDANTGKYKMWNTIKGQNTHEPVDFTVDGKYTTPEELFNLRIEVFKENDWMLLTANKGVAACKILVDDRFPIVPERTPIANEQGNFTTYVQGNWKDEDGFWWVQK